MGMFGPLPLCFGIGLDHPARAGRPREGTHRCPAAPPGSSLSAGTWNRLLRELQG
jgi:hypothetical protein